MIKPSSIIDPIETHIEPIAQWHWGWMGGEYLSQKSSPKRLPATFCPFRLVA
jgi:hypothetical protein